MNTSNGLHQAAIAIAEPNPVNLFHLAQIGTAVFAHRNAAVIAQLAGHATDPQQLLTDMLVGIAVNLVELVQHPINRS